MTKDIEEGKQFTHLTKGRARGPKKRISGKRVAEKSETPTFVQSAPTQRPTIKEEPESIPPVPPKEIKRPITRVSTPQIQPTPPPKPYKVREKPVPSLPVQAVAPKRQIIKDEPDSPPPPQSSIWNKPPIKDRPVTTSSSEKSFDATFPSTPDFFRPSNTATL